MKKIFMTLLTPVLLCVSIILLPTNYNHEVVDKDTDEATVSQMIYNTMQDVDNYVYSVYGNKTDYSMQTTHNYGVLSLINVSQTTLKTNYNSLGDLRFDRNDDGKLDLSDNLDLKNEGICQPTAVSMALKFMYVRGLIDYTPRLSDNKRDINNIFYEVVDAYLQNGWQGAGAARSLCPASMNTFFKRNGANFNATYTTSNLMDRIDAAYESGMPAIGHITGDDGGHAVTICGYYTKQVKYREKVLWWWNDKTVNINFIVINTGWVNANMPEYGGSVPDGEYERNYSYIELKDLAGVTYIS